MEIRIGRQDGKTAVLISFDTDAEKFESAYERNKFFNELHGRKQIIIKEGRRYEYRRPGVLSDIPHMRVDNSVFIIMQEHMRMMQEFFREWEDKVMFRSFPVLLSQREFKEMEQNSEGEEVEVE